jgi:DNA-binding CsgD family transcriptional regulator
MSSATGEALFGREAELRHVYDLIDGAPEAGAALVVRGDAGIGKSALLLQATERARELGFRVVRAAGVPSEAQLAFAALDQLLRPFPDALRHLPAPQRTALETALGRLDAKTPDIFLIALAALGVLSEVASDHPVVIVVEDAHWVDRPTCEVLAFVARRLDMESIVVLFAIRDGVSGVLDAANLPVLRLGPLDDRSAADVLDRTAPALPAKLRLRVLEESAGNPLALIELPKALTQIDLLRWSPDDPIPLTARLERTFAVRLAECPEQTRTLLTLAALEESAELSELLQAAEVMLGRPTTVDALDPAVTAGLGTIEANRFRFRHPLIHSATQQAVTATGRRRAHAALAEVLADEPDRSIWHRAAATVGVQEAVASQLEAAAGRAELRGGTDVAIAALQLASALSEDPRSTVGRLLRAAELAFELGRRDLSLRLLKECKQLDLADHERTTMAYMLELQDSRWSGADAIRALAQIAEDLSQAGDLQRALQALMIVGTRSNGVKLDDATRHSIVAVAGRVAPTRDDPSFLAVAAFADPVGQGREVIGRLAELNPAAFTDPKAEFALGQAAAAVWTDHLALPYLRGASAGFRTTGRLALLAQTLVSEAWAHLHMGNIHAVLIQAAEAMSLATETSQSPYLAAAQTALAIAEAERNHEPTAQQLSSAAESLLVPMGANPLLALVELTRGRIALAGERFTEAYQHLSRIFDVDDIAHQPFICGWALADITDAAVHGGENLHRVRHDIAEWETIAESTGAGHLQAQLAYVRPMLARDREAYGLFNAAVASTVDWPYYRARTQLAFGAWLRRQRRAAESRSRLRDAANLFDALGMTRSGDRARRELRASGESIRRTTPTAWDQLTPQELQIAQLAVGGLTNREIAERLYLSHRTVGSHLYKLFPKLGVTSRTELRAALEHINPTVVNNSLRLANRPPFPSPDS